MGWALKADTALGKTPAWFPAPTLGGAQSPVTLAPEVLTPLASPGTYTETYRHIHRIKSNVNPFLKPLRSIYSLHMLIKPNILDLKKKLSCI